MVFTSYTGSFGSYLVDAVPRLSTSCTVPYQLMAQANGVFTDGIAVRLADISDGTASTLFVAERATGNLQRFDMVMPSLFAGSGWWFSGNLRATLTTSFFPPNMIKRVGPGAGTNHASAASSLHPGGLNALMGDGSVRFVKDTVDTWDYDLTTGKPVGARQPPGGWWIDLPPAGIWQKLASRSGFDVINTDF